MVAVVSLTNAWVYVRIWP